MYLAMGRAAAREGYPEIAEYWKTAAFEEAEHAAKFAELLGEVVSPSTKENLRVRVDAENGATQGKTDLAKKAKELGLDAIHDTVHEMARDEARHGKAFVTGNLPERGDSFFMRLLPASMRNSEAFRMSNPVLFRPGMV